MAEKMRNVFTSVSETVFPGSKALINKRRSHFESGDLNYLLYFYINLHSYCHCLLARLVLEKNPKNGFLQIFFSDIVITVKTIKEALTLISRSY